MPRCSCRAEVMYWGIRGHSVAGLWIIVFFEPELKVKEGKVVVVIVVVVIVKVMLCLITSSFSSFSTSNIIYLIVLIMPCFHSFHVLWLCLVLKPFIMPSFI